MLCKLLSLLGHRAATTTAINNARDDLQQILPVPQIQEATDIMDATVDAILATLQNSTQQLADHAPVDSLKTSVNAITQELRFAQSDMSSAYEQIARRVPGPVLNGTITLVRGQVSLL